MMSKSQYSPSLLIPDGTNLGQTSLSEIPITTSEKVATGTTKMTHAPITDTAMKVKPWCVARMDALDPIALSCLVQRAPLGSQCQHQTTLLMEWRSAAEWDFVTAKQGCVTVGKALRDQRTAY
ncbi:hypothetical protein THAOC_10608 [Thalassiosira oceanica]|uniref:Uncharacterized protein n=1 Tax=Thalassiosira oceanica TaxID=159749 RepID=K0SPM5_THAOC|nr:hypothetical protein THAOC_10608 [Thalassiosira oceanica]|eukprot:EJK68233.1 hypothetical protein THAOC_10608 [Thalassiosira oceanica]